MDSGILGSESKLFGGDEVVFGKVIKDPGIDKFFVDFVDFLVYHGPCGDARPMKICLYDLG